MDLQDPHFISRLQEGEETAFRQLVEACQKQVYNTCLGFLRNEEDAEDIAQEVFIEVYRSMAHFRGEAQLSTWIYRIAVTKSLELIRKRKRKKRFAFLQYLGAPGDMEGDRIAGGSHPGVQLENQERAAILFGAIDKLPENQKTAFLLFKVETLSQKEVAEIMGISVSSVVSLVHRAKQKLRELLTDYYQKHGY
jgi:RNA polymerase sigma-70 factor (ECF subfamily)